MMYWKENNVVVENLAEHIVGENGPYYPDLCLPEQTDYEIGRYGRMRERFLKEHRESLYRELLLNGRLNEHLHETEEECYSRMDVMTEQMKKKQGAT